MRKNNTLRRGVASILLFERRINRLSAGAFARLCFAVWGWAATGTILVVVAFYVWTWEGGSGR